MQFCDGAPDGSTNLPAPFLFSHCLSSTFSVISPHYLYSLISEIMFSKNLFVTPKGVFGSSAKFVSLYRRPQSCIVFRKNRVQIWDRRQVILTEIYRGFSQSFQTNASALNLAATASFHYYSSIIPSLDAVV
jgi:hypothetical protein